MYWTLDHVIPCSKFNMKYKIHQKICHNWKNLQPMEKNKNSSKNNKLNIFELVLQELQVRHYKKIHDVQRLDRYGLDKYYKNLFSLRYSPNRTNILKRTV